MTLSLTYIVLRKKYSDTSNRKVAFGLEAHKKSLHMGCLTRKCTCGHIKLAKTQIKSQLSEGIYVVMI